MGNLSGFYQNYNNIKESGTKLPDGVYNVAIESAEPKPTKNDPNAGFLELSLKVMDGQFSGQYAPKIRLNLWNPSDKAREIAESELKRITTATGIGGIDDSSQLIGKTMSITVRPQKNDPSYSESVNPSPYGMGMVQQQQFNQQGSGQMPPQGQNGGGGAPAAPQAPAYNPGAVPPFSPSAPAQQPNNSGQPQEQQPAYTPSFRP